MKKENVKNVRQLVNYLGGDDELSDRLSNAGMRISKQGVRKWIYLGNIPLKWWPFLCDYGDFSIDEMYQIVLRSKKVKSLAA